MANVGLWTHAMTPRRLRQHFQELFPICEVHVEVLCPILATQLHLLVDPATLVFDAAELDISLVEPCPRGRCSCASGIQEYLRVTRRLAYLRAEQRDRIGRGACNGRRRVEVRKEGRGREAVVGVLARKVVLRGEAGEEEGPEAKSRLSFVEVPSCVELNVDNYSRGCPDKRALQREIHACDHRGKVGQRRESDIH